MKLIPNLLLSIGAMKAGTSWLFEQLRDHPEVDSAPIKEIHYFAHVHTALKMLSNESRFAIIQELIRWIGSDMDPAYVSKLLHWCALYVETPVDDVWFANLFTSRHTKKYCADFSNLHCLLEGPAWEHIRSITEALRVIYTVRDPLSRLWSHTRYHCGIMGIQNWATTWTDTEFRRFFCTEGLLIHGAYSKTLERLARNLSPEEYRVFLFEDFREAPLETLRNLEAFLDLRSHRYSPTQLQTIANPSLVTEMPRAFLTAARPYVAEEIVLLDRVDFAVPCQWIREYDSLPGF